MVHENDNQNNLDRDIDSCRDSDRMVVESTPENVRLANAWLLDIDCGPDHLLMQIKFSGQLEGFAGGPWFVPRAFGHGFVKWVNAYTRSAEADLMSGDQRAREREKAHLQDYPDCQQAATAQPRRSNEKRRPWYMLRLIDSGGVKQSECNNIHIGLIDQDRWTLCGQPISELRPIDDAIYKNAIQNSQACFRCFMIMQFMEAVQNYR